MCIVAPSKPFVNNDIPDLKEPNCETLYLTYTIMLHPQLISSI